MFLTCNAVCVSLRLATFSPLFLPEQVKSRPTSVENILEDQLRSLVIEGWQSSEKLKETHPQRPPVHHAV